MSWLTLYLPDPALQWLAGLGVLTSILAVLALLSTLGLRRQLRALRLHAAGLEADLLAIRQALFQLDASKLSASARQGQLETQLRLLAEQQEQLKQRDANTGPYLNAIRDAQRGLDVAALMANHGVNKGEAELIRALHGPRPAAD